MLIKYIQNIFRQENAFEKVYKAPAILLGTQSVKRSYHSVLPLDDTTKFLNCCEIKLMPTKLLA